MRLHEITKPSHYIRFGDIPEGERSTIGAAPNWMSKPFRPGDTEVGVSVFDTEWSDRLQRWEIVDIGNMASLDALLRDRRPAFLVTGKAVGFGMDQETLLRKVKIIEPLPYDRLWVRGWGNDGACEEYLEDSD